MRLSKKRYDEIDQSVYHLLMDFDPHGLPFDVVSIAEFMGIKLCPYSSLAKGKREWLLNNEKTSTGFHITIMRDCHPVFWIFYNDGLEEGRWLYTISHEVGHITLGHGSKPTPEQECEAEYFAKQLMAPRCLALARRMTSPMEIHSSFRLSWEAAEYLASSVTGILASRGTVPYANDEEFLSWCKEKG